MGLMWIIVLIPSVFTLGVVMGKANLFGRSALRKMVHQANQDVLTGLPNRAEAMAALQSTIAKHPEDTTVALVDVDGLKDTNDTYGHAAGDELIVGVANQLHTVVIEIGGLVARMGGDEFLIVTTATPE